MTAKIAKTATSYPADVYAALTQYRALAARSNEGPPGGMCDVT